MRFSESSVEAVLDFKMSISRCEASVNEKADDVTGAMASSKVKNVHLSVEKTYVRKFHGECPPELLVVNTKNFPLSDH